MLDLILSVLLSIKCSENQVTEQSPQPWIDISVNPGPGYDPTAPVMLVLKRKDGLPATEYDKLGALGSINAGKREVIFIDLNLNFIDEIPH